MNCESPKIGALHLNESLAFTGGTEGYILDLARLQVARSIPTRLGSGRKEQLELANISYVIPGIHKKTDQHTLENNIDTVRRIMDRDGLQIIHLHNVHNPDLYSSLSALFPVVRTVHDHRTSCPIEFKVKPDGEICTQPVSPDCQNCTAEEVEITNRQELINATSQSDLILTASQYMKDQLTVNGVPEEKIKVVPLFAPINAAPQSPVPEKYLSDFLFIGRITKAKGLSEAIKAISKINRNYHFIVCGDGPDLVECQLLVEQLGISDKVHFVGWTNKEEKAKYLFGTNTVIVPPVWPEPFCLVGLEAMNFKKPVVGFNVGGISEWLRDEENGFLVRRGDLDQMAHCLETMLSSKQTRINFGTIGRTILDTDFSIEKHLSGLETVYRKLT